jgi:Spy/CpxP family protein refolding chaperone
MKKLVVTVAMMCTLATVVVAQNPGPRTHEGRGGGGGGRFRGLNLTAAQQEQANSIFEAERTAAEPVRDQLEAAQTALYNAARANAGDAELDRLAQTEAPLLAQLEAIRAKAFASFYAILTPEQRAILDSAPGRAQAGFGRFR